MKYSLTTKITVVFALAFSLVCILFYTFANIQLDNALEKIKNKQLNAINYLIASYEKSNPPSDLTIYFRNFGLTYVKSDKTVANVLSGGKTIFAKQTQLGLFQSLLFQDSLYLQIKNPSFQILLESDDTKNINDPIWVGFILTSALLISLYVSVINSLMPLKKLSSDIRKFGAGNMDVNIAKPDSNDEIAKVAIEFDAAASKIRELLRSRQLFLRTIMHELKTPIGKGRIVSEMVQNETHKSRLIAIFERLDMLINEFGKIEQLLSKNYALNYQESYFSNILEQARDMLMLDKFEEKVSVDIRQDILLRVDFGLFSLAITNLIDNALKYAYDKKAQVICDKDGIVVRNLGKPLQNPVEYYLQAFIREKGNKSGGMGLGLYIIDHICQMHKFSLKYSYEDGYHAFKICTKPKESVEKRA